MKKRTNRVGFARRASFIAGLLSALVSWQLLPLALAYYPARRALIVTLTFSRKL